MKKLFIQNKIFYIKLRFFHKFNYGHFTLNYDKYPKKAFSNVKIAKKFLEDFLDIEIAEIPH